MSDKDIRLGDVVRLNSGGPNMVVVGVRRGADTTSITTVWSGEHQPHASAMQSAHFDSRTLTVMLPAWDGT